MKTEKIIAALAAALTVLTACEKENRTMEVTLDQDSVSFTYGETAKVTYSVKDADSKVQVSTTSDAVSIRSQEYSTSTDTGSLTLEAKNDEDATVMVPLVFSDGKTETGKVITVKIESDEITVAPGGTTSMALIP